MINWLKKIFKHNSKKELIKIRLEMETENYYEEFVDPDKYEQRLSELKTILTPINPLDKITFIWCLVGNIVDKHFSGESKEIKHGTKQFSSGTKVYCFPAMWGDGYEKIKVIGRHRKSNKFITIITESKYITNWRLQSVYSPYIIKTMYENKGWANNENDKTTILEMLKWLPEKTKSIN